jgi:mannose-6-phosphate isomerase-like protein (cupin superfamily)
MRLINTGKSRSEFEIIAASRSVQVAMMTLRPGGTSDDEPSNEHRRSEQWVFILAGTGVVTIGKRKDQLKKVRLTENALLLIEKGELHQIKNTGRKQLRTINFYAPPAYDANEEPIK